MSSQEDNTQSNANDPKPPPQSCPAGGCGTGKGMCPGIALVIGIIVGTGVASLLTLEWLGTPLTVAVALVLILGFYPGGGRWPLKR
jgi:hypothetical protein